MSEVTKEDINRIYDTLEPMGKDLAVIKSQMGEHLGRLEKHLDSHEDTLKTWKHMAIGGVVKVAVVSIIGFVCYCWGLRK